MLIMLRENLARLFNKFKKFREGSVNLKLPRFLNPIDSIRQLILWFAVYGGVSFVVSSLIDWFRGTIPIPTWDTFTATLFLGVILWASTEEILFRLLPKRGIGNLGLLVGTIVWILMHPFNTSPPLWYRTPTDILLGIFYIKLWRGKWWWLSFIIHSLWNIMAFLLPLTYHTLSLS
ncbi:type II CAAX prenyl endopeptidase Rce1 family protein [Chloroflexota bacterium]